jgi:hypothetical protein
LRAPSALLWVFGVGEWRLRAVTAINRYGLLLVSELLAAPAWGGVPKPITQTHQSSVLHGSPAHLSAASAFSAREINGPSLSLHLLRRRRSLRVLCVLRVSNLKSRTGISSHPAGSQFLNPQPPKSMHHTHRKPVKPTPIQKQPQSVMENNYIVTIATQHVDIYETIAYTRSVTCKQSRSKPGFLIDLRAPLRPIAHSVNCCCRGNARHTMAPQYAFVR